jgi:hypothetical protein
MKILLPNLAAPGDAPIGLQFHIGGYRRRAPEQRRWASYRFHV